MGRYVLAFILLALVLASWLVLAPAAGAQAVVPATAPPSSPGMGGLDAMAIGALVVAMVTFVKWAGWVSDRRAPVAVLILSGLGVGLWLLSQEQLPIRQQAFEIVVALFNVVFTAGGIWGLTRASSSAFTRGAGDT